MKFFFPKHLLVVNIWRLQIYPIRTPMEIWRDIISNHWFQYLIWLGTGPWNLKLARKDQIHSNFPKYGFEAPRVHWCTRKNFWWSRGGARFCDHMIKNVDFRQYRQFLDPSLSDVPILLFKEDYDDIYRFLISRKKYFFGPKMAIFRTKIK